MELSTASFDFEYVPVNLKFGRECVSELGQTLDRLECSRALIVCGSNVGANPDVMDPIKNALEDRLVGVFDETTPQKYIGTVCDGAERIDADEPDVLVAVGSGSSLNIARAMSEVAALEMSREEVIAETEQTGTVPVPEVSVPIPNVAVPTTMAGADLSPNARLFLSEEPMPPAAFGEERASALLDDDRLMPETIFYDPEMFATTPTSILTSSAMNGFDKGIETVYSRLHNPISDAHAFAGLRYLRQGLPGIADPSNEDALDLAVIGIALVQYERFTNIIHTFGNGVSLYYPIQQGDIHGITAPHVLRYVFDQVDGRRRLLGESLGVDVNSNGDDEIADAIVDVVASVRDDLGLPTRLRDVDSLESDHLPALSETILDNPKHARNPPELEPTTGEIQTVLEEAW